MLMSSLALHGIPHATGGVVRFHESTGERTFCGRQHRGDVELEHSQCRQFHSGSVCLQLLLCLLRAISHHLEPSNQEHSSRSGRHLCGDVCLFLVQFGCLCRDCVCDCVHHHQSDRFDVSVGYFILRHFTSQHRHGESFIWAKETF